MESDKIIAMEDQYRDYLSDESGMTGTAGSISFPESEDELRSIFLTMKQGGTPVTIQGGRTGIVGGAVPDGGHIINMSRLNKLHKLEFTDSGAALLEADPGITRLELTEGIQKLKGGHALFWPPDPTEPSASLGGIIASGAQGISTGLYGRTEEHIEAVRIMDSEGNFRTVQRDDTDFGAVYFGSEGRYGIITKVRLRLRKKPDSMWGIAFFFEQKADSYQFADMLKEKFGTGKNSSPKSVDAEIHASIAVCEYIDRVSIDLVEERKPYMTKIRSIPDIDSEAAAMIYTEIHGSDEEAVSEIAEELLEISVSCGSDPDKAWAVSGETEIDKMRSFRHAVPESINLLMEKRRKRVPGLLKQGSDMSFPQMGFKELLNLYEKDLQDQQEMQESGLQWTIFGHIRENHLHINFLPETQEQYDLGNELITSWAERCRKVSGAVIYEHGMGKIRKPLFVNTADRPVLEEMRQRKQKYDPAGLLNKGNSIDD
ncbi:MAG: FAD-binding oxidoreductase [Spirochaetales bacterium]|nr:FAD-binding oxidoreductase [Spirochaetales bacterium]